VTRSYKYQGSKVYLLFLSKRQHRLKIHPPQPCHGIEELTISVGNRPQTGIGDIASLEHLAAGSVPRRPPSGRTEEHDRALDIRVMTPLTTVA